MSSKDKIVMSGLRPTGNLHLGNYFGAVRNYIRLQNSHTCFFMVADLHALTTLTDVKVLKGYVLQVMAENIACGLDPEKAVFYCQSQVPETSELYLILNMVASLGELEKTPTFKEKARLQPMNLNAGLLTYPVLQAADILLHRANLVPVGKDQEQHLEMARNIVNRFNHRYGPVFPEPYAFNFGEDLVKVPSLDGSGKMSKSESQTATIYLNDDNLTIQKKVGKAKTDSFIAGNREIPDSIQNLLTLLQLVCMEDEARKFETAYQSGNLQFSDLKDTLAEGIIAFVSPIRQKVQEILADPTYLQRIMAEGSEKARESARNTMQLVREAVGLRYYQLMP